MIIYILNVIMVIIYNFFIKDKKKYILLVSFQLFLILALRSVTLGVDLDYYSSGYYYIKTLNFTSILSKLHFFQTASLIYPYNYESGYALFCWLISNFNFNFHAFLVFCAAINMYVFGKLIYKYSENPCMSFIIFCTFGTYIYFFGILRQSLALSFFILSFIAYNDNKKIKSLVLCILSFWFHRVAILMIPLLFLANKKNLSKKKALLYFAGIFPFALCSKYIYACIYKIMLIFGKSKYVGTEFKINNLVILLIFIYLILIFFVSFKKQEKNKLFSKYVYALIIAIYLGIIGTYNEVFGRTVQLFTPFLILLIPYVLKLYSFQKTANVIKYSIVLLLIGFMIYYIPSQNIVPYVVEKNISIFDK